jgi:chromosome segregation ATPase
MSHLVAPFVASELKKAIEPIKGTIEKLQEKYDHKLDSHTSDMRDFMKAVMERDNEAHLEMKQQFSNMLNIIHAEQKLRHENVREINSLRATLTTANQHINDLQLELSSVNNVSKSHTVELNNRLIKLKNTTKMTLLNRDHVVAVDKSIEDLKRDLHSTTENTRSSWSTAHANKKNINQNVTDIKRLATAALKHSAALKAIAAATTIADIL